MITNIKHDIRSYLSSKVFALPIFGIKKINRDLPANINTDIVIEGYPRSANTFAVVGFEKAQQKNINIAHHLHIPSQILFAEKHTIPSLLLIRNPMDAIKSLIVRHKNLDVNRCFRDYILFYETLYPISNYPVIGEFENVTNNFGGVVEQINNKFKVSFDVPVHDKFNTEEIFDLIGKINKNANRTESQIAIPSKYKEKEKSESIKVIKNRSDNEIIKRSYSIYDKYIKLL